MLSHLRSFISRLQKAPSATRPPESKTNARNHVWFACPFTIPLLYHLLQKFSSISQPCMTRSLIATLVLIWGKCGLFLVNVSRMVARSATAQSIKVHLTHRAATSASFPLIDGKEKCSLSDSGTCQLTRTKEEKVWPGSDDRPRRQWPL